jgi:enamine deaminase RidA (YjgF/YER057c/UK114 family)
MKVINPESLGMPHGYSNGVLYPSGKILFVAGQIGWDKGSHLAVGLTLQFQRALQNVLKVVREAGGSPESIGRFTIYIKDKKEYKNLQKEIGQAYRQLMGKHFPAIALLVVKDFMEEGAMVEIEATAMIP